ncbi:dTDP-4-amino-4,6-dideoxy-D-galactose acyltransferase [Algoriphagus boseongensis]|uniref:dTDP-4-amino-4,6-dideoxy-D-galactose acyltransferase n=1 Tax=Algoriphagus boseongensis TaxID=1442587 RepID=A0A4R6TBL0_9BACT|nr:GNAT family N-acetyltransferase [Algoriphagus boseongensis]TDQ19599.1 dTDP-4-amino-4,6-dideoxy-D-galactose acyltransferase [Algoriphagus boseongensis]
MVIQSLPFDSELFGYSVGKVNWEPDFDEKEFLEKAKTHQLVYVFSGKPISFQSPKIQLADQRLVFRKEILEANAPEGILSIFDYLGKFSAPNLRKTLLDLALASGEYSRFKMDERLKNGEFEKLYKLWLEKAWEQNQILFPKGLEGMVSFNLKDDAVQIGLLAVGEEHRGQAWGRKLIQAAEQLAFSKGKKYLIIPTQSRNQSAVQFYEKLGYQVVEETWIYHYWAD